MHMTGGDRVGIDERNPVRVRQHDVLVRRRRRVAAEHAPDLDRRLEAAQELEAVLAELLLRPARCPEQALDILRLLRAEVEREQELIRVAEDAGAAELLQQLDALARLRPALRDVAERDDQIGLTILQVGEGGAEGDGVAVHVAEEGDSHTGTPYAANAAASAGSAT